MRSRARLQSHPIHPMLVAFPIGLWVTGFLFDAIGVAGGSRLYWSAGYFCMVAGCVGAVLAAAAGLTDLLTVVPPNSSAKKRGYMHGALNTIVLLLFTYLAIRRGSPREMPDNTELLIAGIALVVMGVSGWMGGTLVYRNQIGIDRRYANAGTLRERNLRGWDQPVCNVSELGDGQMMLAIRDRERVVVSRCGQTIAAFSDHCTHRGGPLSDGALVGCTVQCPWHGSQFDVITGRVVAGPAQNRIKTYEVEVRNGEVYILERRGARMDEPSQPLEEPRRDPREPAA